MIGLDKRRVALNLLKLFVLVLFTLNLYIFTSNTLKYASSPPQTLKLEQRLVLVAADSKIQPKPNKEEESESVAAPINYNNYNNCSYMGFNLSNGECDLFITVKTTSSFYMPRVRAILETWFKLVPSKVCLLLLQSIDQSI